jgi:hypothetical protein
MDTIDIEIERSRAITSGRGIMAKFTLTENAISVTLPRDVPGTMLEDTLPYATSKFNVEFRNAPSKSRKIRNADGTITYTFTNPDNSPLKKLHE